MAYISINSKFTPFTYDELERPFKEYGEQYEKNSEAMATLGEQADIWKSLANQQTDPIAYGRYKAYADSLDTQVNSMAKNGLNAGTKQNIIDLRRRYSSEIRPIMKAYEDKQKEIERQSAMQDKDHSIMFSRNAQTTSLDDYLTGKITPYAQVSGTELAAKANTLGQAISKRYFRTKEGRAFSNAYFNYINSQGYDSKQAAEILAREKNPDGTPKYPEFEKGINDLLGSTDVQQLSATDKQKALDNVMYGINTGITYDQKNQLLENWPMKMAMEEAAGARKAKAAAMQNTEMATYNPARAMPRVDANPNAIKNHAAYVSWVNFLSTIAKDPRRMTNAANMKTYVNIMRQLGQNVTSWTPEMNNWALSQSNHKVAESALKHFSYPINITNSSLIRQGLVENAGALAGHGKNTGIQEVDSSGRTKKGYLSIEDFNKFTEKNFNIEYDPLSGIAANGYDSDGKYHRMVIPSDYFENTGTDLATALKQVKQAMAKGDYESAGSLKDGIVSLLYETFNSMQKKQGETEQ